MDKRGSLASVVCIALGLAGPVAWAADGDEGSAKYLSRDSVSRVDSGLDFTFQPGMRWFGATHALAFSDPEAGGAAVFGGGTGVDLGLHYRFNGSSSLGVEFGLAGHGSEPTFQSTQFSTNTYKLVGRLSQPLTPLWFEVSGGLGYFNAVQDGVAGASSVARAGLLGAKLGVQFEPISTLPGLSFGAYVGAEAWFANQSCSTSGTAAPACTEVSDATNFAFQGGLAARFVLPLSLVPPPPKPPTAEYILVRSRLQVSTSDSMSPEVTDTEAYRSALPKVRKVALAAPDYCASKTAANTTGQAAHTDSVVQTKCGVEMSEIERALTKEGYAVHSWTTLDAMVRDGKMTARDAAAKLGAQVLFQVNSLEHVQAQPSTQARWERSYFASNEYGTQGQAVQPSQADLVSLHPLMQQPELAALPGVVQGAMLDVNAILVESGQTIWFYRWQRLDTASTGSEVSALAQKMSDDVAWRAVVPRPSGAVQPAPAPVESASFQSNGGPASVKDARYFQLMREVVTDFVRRFTKPAAATN